MNLRDYKPNSRLGEIRGKIHKIVKKQDGSEVSACGYTPSYYAKGFSDNWENVTCKCCILRGK